MLLLMIRSINYSPKSSCYLKIKQNFYAAVKFFTPMAARYLDLSKIWFLVNNAWAIIRTFFMTAITATFFTLPLSTIRSYRILKGVSLRSTGSTGMKSILRRMAEPLLDILVFFLTEVPEVASTGSRPARATNSFLFIPGYLRKNTVNRRELLSFIPLKGLTQLKRSESSLSPRTIPSIFSTALSCFFSMILSSP